jgi:two-component system, NtrC family, sensor histidine kinase HydH
MAMRITILLALLAGALLTLALVRIVGRGRADTHDWLPSALRALSIGGEPSDLTAILTRHVQIGLGAAHVAWWRRDEEGVYRTATATIDAAAARRLDQWVELGAPWHRAEVGSADVDATRVLRDIEADLVLPLRVRGRAVGILALGSRSDHRRYGEEDVARLGALADHLLVVADRVELAVMLDESRRMLQQATRLSTVGTLAAELAHEIRNPLVAVQTFLQILPERLDDPEVTGELRGVALIELQRVARLLNELLGMARASVATFAATDLDNVVDQVVHFLQVSARKKEVMLERLGDPLPNGAADASRLKQALVNLVLNAIQASPAGATVTVTTRIASEGGARQTVEIAIHDEGPGIPETDRETIFHPFFTTKESGTGLGLPVTRQIISDHGGSIAVQGEVGHGATFVIRLPLNAPQPERRDKLPDVRAA